MIESEIRQYFAYAVAKPGAHIHSLSSDNTSTAEPWRVRQAVETDEPYFVQEIWDHMVVADCDAPTAPIDAELIAEKLSAFGAKPVIVNSGNLSRGGRHVYAVVPDKAAREKFKVWVKKSLKTGTKKAVDMRGNGIRPPFTPHRCGDDSTLICPKKPLAALRALSPGGVLLPLRTLQLLDEGSAVHNFPSRSEAEYSVAIELKLAGGDKELFRAVLSQSLSDVGGHYRDHANPDEYLALTWRNACRAIDSGQVRKARRLVAKAHTAASATTRDWSGNGGALERQLLRSIHTLAEKLGKRHVGVDVRTAALMVYGYESTGSKALRSLERKGWLRRQAEAGGGKGRVWSIAIPSHAPSRAATANEEARTLNTYMRGGCVSDCSSSFASPVWSSSGLGWRAAEIWNLLPETITEQDGCPSTAEVIAKHLGVGLRTVQQKLCKLEESHLAERGRTGHWCRGGLSLLEAADSMGLSGLPAMLEQRFDRQREAFREECNDTAH